MCPCHQSMFNVRNGAVPQFGPAPRPLPQLPLGYNDDGYLVAMAPYDQAVGPASGSGPRHERTAAAKTKRSAKAAMGPYGQVGKVVDELDDRLGVAKGGRVFLDKIFPDHWSFMLGEISLYSFIVLLATGVFLSLYFVPSTQQVVYHGSYDAAERPVGLGGLRLDGQHLLRRPRRPARPPDAPLGGRHLHRLDHRPHGPHLLHRCVPQAPRAELDSSASRC